MFEAMGVGLNAVLQPNVFFLVLFGSLTGLVVGMMPGLGGVFLLAMSLPFTYGWDQMSAFALYSGLTGGIPFGGSVTAILINTPGTPENIATTFDGFPMSQKGEGGKALGLSASASGLGSIFGLVLLVLLIPVARPVVLSFGPREIFMLVLFGLVAVAYAAKGNMLRGLVAGGLGIIISMIGFTSVHGLLRFTFGSFYLWDGIPLVPWIIGLFAISEVLMMWDRGEGSISAGGTSGKLTGVWDGVVEVFRHPWLFLRSSALGVLIGIIPGVGASKSCILAYVAAKQFSRHPEKYGTGFVEGVLAPESANNSTHGGSLFTTVAFGIPGSSGMVIILAAFILHGLVPGPSLLRDHLDLVFCLVFAYGISAVFASVIGLVCAKYLARITFVSISYIIPVVVMLCLTGSYIARGNIWDVLLALIAGGLGYCMKKFGFPIACFVLGYVLGIMAEDNFFLALSLADGNYATFVTHPISLGLLLLLVFMILSPVVKSIFKKEEALK